MTASNRWVGEAKASCPSFDVCVVAVILLPRVLSEWTRYWKGNEMLWSMDVYYTLW